MQNFCYYCNYTNTRFRNVLKRCLIYVTTEWISWWDVGEEVGMNDSKLLRLYFYRILFQTCDEMSEQVQLLTQLLFCFFFLAHYFSTNWLTLVVPELAEISNVIRIFFLDNFRENCINLKNFSSSVLTFLKLATVLSNFRQVLMVVRITLWAFTNPLERE